MKNYIYKEFKFFLAYQAVLPTVKGSLSLDEYQAGLPGKVASLTLLLRSKSLKTSCLFRAEILTNSIVNGNLGVLILKTFNQTLSNNATTKNPIAIAEMVNKTHPSSKVINGTKIQQLKNLIKRTFGKYLAYWSNCVGVIFQSSVISVGRVCHNLSLNLYKIRSIIEATIGYIKIPNAAITFKYGFLINSATKVAIKLVTSNFGIIARYPEQAITFGLLKNFELLRKFSNFILVFTLFFCSDLFKVAQNYLKLHMVILNLVNYKGTSDV